MAETGIWNGCCVIGVRGGGAPVDRLDFGSRPHEQELMLVELSPLWLWVEVWVWLGWELLWVGRERQEGHLSMLGYLAGSCCLLVAVS